MLSSKKRQKNREYYLKNKDLILKRSSEYRKNNFKELSRKRKIYYQENTEHRKDTCKKSYLKHKDEILEKSKRRYTEQGGKELYYIYHLKRQFNLTFKEYNDLAATQNHCCAICGINKKDLDKRLAVDHCHKTGLIRGLLCCNCNRFIGLIGDKVETAKNVVKYLSKYQI